VAITTMDGLLAALQPFGEDVIKAAFTGEASGQYHSSLYLAGRPGAGAVPAPGLNGAALTSYAGQIPVPALVAGKNIHLARFEFAQAANVGAATLIDRLWHNSGLVVATTTAQAITPVALPSRDNNGLTDGSGVLAALEVSTTGTAGAITNTTMSYTNELGVSGRTGTIASFPATPLLGTFVPFLLQAGDLGVRSVQSVTLGTAYTTAVIHLVLYREICSLGSVMPNVVTSAGPVELALPRVYDSSVLQFLFLLSGTAAGITNAQLTFAQG
jgi:hypothetical protein